MIAVERAPAKVNVTLTVTGRRVDGYHTLESLVAFAHDIYDEVMLVPGPALTLAAAGATADKAGPVDSNLILKAARALRERREGLRLGAFNLKKNLPVAAGLGGGSADAAAALRLLARLNDLPLDDAAILDAAHATGADVAVCLQPQARVMRGIGEQLGPALDFSAPHVLLVNPHVACPTPAVFQALGLEAGKTTGRTARPDAAILKNWQAIGNDLQPAAVSVVPVIATVLAMLEKSGGCVVARMSGSGATCFGSYENAADCARAAEILLESHPHWWVARTILC